MTTRSAGTPWLSISPRTRSTVRSADVSHGSFRSIGARNDSGYHVRPAAAGAKYAMSDAFHSSASC